MMHGLTLKTRKRKRRLRVFLCLLIFIFYFLNIGIFIPTFTLIIFELRNEIRQFIRQLLGKNLFEGYDKLFKRHVKGINIYGEYGVGNSTKWVYKNTDAKIIAVDTSQEWIDIVQSKMKDLDRVQIEWVDLGELGEWGTPLSYKKRDFIRNYLESIWKNQHKPELVLIDGRFRVACFLYSLLKSDPGSKIIFDDYKKITHYQVVEEFIKPIESHGNQVLFIVPDMLPIEKIEKTISEFIHVLE